MPGIFTKISSEAFEDLQLDAGVILNKFDPANPVEPADEDIICATTGGVNPSCVPSYSDFGEDVDNAPNGTKELKHLDGWECKLSTTALGTSPETIRLALGAADVDGDKVTPRMSLKNTDFADLWWVGDRADGGFAAVKLKNALSTGGFSLQTTKNGKGTIALELTGHVSIKNQKVVPMEFYSAEGEEPTPPTPPTPTTPTAQLSSLEVGSLELDPTFDKDVYSYYVPAEAEASTAITANPVEDDAVITIEVEGGSIEDNNVTWGSETTVIINVAVTRDNVTVEKDYTLSNIEPLPEQ